MNTILNKLKLTPNKPLCNVGDPKNVFTNVAVWFIACLTFALTSIFGVASVSASPFLSVDITPTISLDLIPSSTGTFASSSTSDTTVSVMTDNYTGYSLGISASNSTITALTNTNDSNSTISSIDSPIDESTFSTNTNYNNKWGYKPSKFRSSNNTNFLPAPTAEPENPDILDQTSTANATTANTYNIAIGAKVDLNVAPGTYANTYVITVVANGAPYTITYNQNTTATVSNMPANITTSDNKVSYADTVSLGTTTPTRTGYTFKGWCTTAEATSETACSGTLYSTANNNLSSYPIDRTSGSNDIAVSAIWQVNTYSITYNLNGGTASNPSSYTKTSSTIALSNPTKSGYQFMGWYGSNDVSGGLDQYTASNPYIASFRDHILGNEFSVIPGIVYRVFVTAKKIILFIEVTSICMR